MTIIYRRGDATEPRGDGAIVVVQVCNDLGKWGKGFVLAVSKRWREPADLRHRVYLCPAPGHVLRGGRRAGTRGKGRANLRLPADIQTFVPPDMRVIVACCTEIDRCGTHRTCPFFTEAVTAQA